MKKAPTIKIDSKTTPVKKVKRSYKKGAVKAPKTSSSKKTGSSKSKSTKSSSPRISSPKTKKRVDARKILEREQKKREAARKRQEKLDAYIERQSNREVRAYERAQAKLDREINKAIREHFKKEEEKKRAERYEKQKAITKNKIEAAGRDPEDYREGVMSLIADKVSDYAFTSEENMEELSKITGLTPEDLKRKNFGEMSESDFKELAYSTLDAQNLTEEELTKRFRALESFGRRKRVHITGIEMDIDPEVAHQIEMDILNSDKVSEAVKDMIGVLGHKGTLLYLNYRQIQKLKFGNNYKEQFYNAAAETFWDDSASNVTAKKYGYKFGKKKRTAMDQSDLGFAGDADATAFGLYAMSTMNMEEAQGFVKAISSIDGFDKKKFRINPEFLKKPRKKKER